MVWASVLEASVLVWASVLESAWALVWALEWVWASVQALALESVQEWASASEWSAPMEN